MNKLETSEGMQPGEFVEWNRKYLDLTTESVKNDHELSCGITEYLQVAEFFLYYVAENEHYVPGLPMQKNKSRPKIFIT